MDNKGFYEHDLKINLETQIDLYEQDRHRYWNEALGEGEYTSLNIAYEQAERFAKAILSGVESLISCEEMEADLDRLDQEMRRIANFPGYWQERMKRILGSGASKEEQVQLVWELLQEKPPEPQDEDSSLRLVWERIFVDLAWAAVDKIDEGAERTFRLYTLVLSVRPSKATQKFLGRLGRCYIWGFESECVMLCRSVSDTAFHEAINDEVCEQQFGKHHGEFTLGDRILAAQKEGMIDEAAYNLAIGVKVRGNKAVHCQPDITQDILATIRDTLTVLEKLHKRK